MLLGEDRRGDQHQDLLALACGLEGGAQGDLGLAVADVATHQSIHRPGRFHVGLDQFDRLQLVGGLGEREALLELALPVGVGLEGVAGTAATLGVKAEQLARQLLGGPASARLHRLPAGAAQLRQRRPPIASATHVARDLGQLVGGDEDLVVALVFQIQVVARHVGHRAGLKAREASHAVVLVHDDVARAQLGEGAQGPAPGTPAAEAVSGPAGPAPARPLGAATAQQTMLGVDGQLQRGRHEALAQRGGGETQRRLQGRSGDIDVGVQPVRFEAPQVVGGPLAFPAPGEGHDRAIARSHKLLELRLGFCQRARRGVGGGGPQLDLLSA